MAEFSGLWTTSGSPSGDQQASYTQAQLAIMHKIVAACSGFEGVAPGFLNKLAVTANGANTVAVATGGAMVDGLFYHNDASQNINIPSASGGGNTRIDRIVLRASWSGFNVSAHRIAGTNAAEPTAPAMTQTSGSTYDIPLAQVLVDTGGNCTVTDERAWAMVARGSSLAISGAGDLIVAVNAISTDRIQADAVDDTKVGNRVPQFYRRQGGNASNWSTPGTTTYTPTTVRMQAGTIDCGVINDNPDSGTQAVTFPTAFSQAPHIQLTRADSNDFPVFIKVTSPLATGFTVEWEAADVAAGTNLYVNWLAIGAE